MAEQDPIVKLEPGGKAAILSYDVPERTSLAGRNLIGLDIPQDWFRLPTRPAPPKSPSSLLARAAAGAAIRGEPLPAAALEALGGGDAPPQVYETLSGDLAVRDARLGSEDEHLPIEDRVPTGPSTKLAFGVVVDTPGDGSTVVGQVPGVDVAVTGRASVTSGYGSITAVDVRVGSGDFKPATPSAPGNFNPWSATVRLSASGMTKITARATHNSGHVRLKEITVTADLRTAPVQDTVPPVITLESPADNSPVVAPEGRAAVEVIGRATDNKGVKAVTLHVDDGPPTGVTLTDGRFKASVLVVGEGPHTITARAVDEAGNADVDQRGVVLMLAQPTEVVWERLVLVESYRLTSFNHRYGAGQTMHALTLAPGEETVFAVRSYRRDRELAKKTSTIFDSLNQESSTEFQTTVTNEQSYKNTFDDSWEWNVRGDVQATWGWGSANVEGSVGGATQSAREEFSKTIKSAVQKHAGKASAQRTVQVSTSVETEHEEGVEESVTRQIRNVNLSRTLNIVLRQLNQEFLSALCLTDCRVAAIRKEIVDGEERTTYQEVALPQLDALIRDRIVEDRQADVRQLIRRELELIWDFQDKPVRFVEEVPLIGTDGKPIPGTEYLRVRRNLWSTWVVDPATDEKRTLQGVITAVASNVLRTDALVAEVLLGRADGLDRFSHGLQETAVETEQTAVMAAKARVEREQLAIELVKTKNSDGAKIYDQVYGDSDTEDAVARAAVPSSGNGHAE